MTPRSLVQANGMDGELGEGEGEPMVWQDPEPTAGVKCCDRGLVNEFS